MSPRILAGFAAVTLASALVAPVSASADHRHSRSCGHRSYRPSYDDRYSRYDDGRYSRYDDGYRSRGYDDRYYSRGYRPDPYYSQGYSPYPRYESRPYYYAKPVRFHYHGRSRCSRSHSSGLSFHLRF